jgi:hypothetical protein
MTSKTTHYIARFGRRDHIELVPVDPDGVEDFYLPAAFTDAQLRYFSAVEEAYDVVQRLKRDVLYTQLEEYAAEQGVTQWRLPLRRWRAAVSQSDFAHAAFVLDRVIYALRHNPKRRMQAKALAVVEHAELVAARSAQRAPRRASFPRRSRAPSSTTTRSSTACGTSSIGTSKSRSSIPSGSRSGSSWRRSPACSAAHPESTDHHQAPLPHLAAGAFDVSGCRS